MCIIMIKPIGKDLPNKQIFEEMFSNNPHGNGFMYNENDSVILKKGYMDFKSFYDAILAIPNPKDKTIVCHMRIATHGIICPQNCHPFPISNKVEDYQALSLELPIAYVHNGIINIDITEKNDIPISDTMQYGLSHLYNYYQNDNNFYKNKDILEQIKKEITSKMCILDSTGHYELIGDFIEDSGILYSNSSYTPYVFKSWKLRDKGSPTMSVNKKEENEGDESEYITLGDMGDMQYCRELEYDEFVLIDGMRVYGDEMGLYLADDDCVYMYDDDKPTKVSNEGYNEFGEILEFDYDDFSFVM